MKRMSRVILPLFLILLVSLTACVQEPAGSESLEQTNGAEEIESNEMTRPAEVSDEATQLTEESDEAPQPAEVSDEATQPDEAAIAETTLNPNAKTASGILLKQDGEKLYLYFPDMMSVRGLREVVPAEGVDIPADLKLGNTVQVSYEKEGADGSLSALALKFASGGSIIKPYFRIPMAEGLKIAEAIEEARLIDMRESSETSLGIVPGAELFPMSELDEAKLFELADSGVPLLVYCRSGNRSGRAMMALKNAGAPLVLNIGGMIEYEGEPEIPEP